MSDDDVIQSVKGLNAYYNSHGEYDDSLRDVYVELDQEQPDHFWVEKRLLFESEKDNPVAQYALGCWYIEGKYHYKRDLKKGISLLHKSADKRVPESCMLLAKCYEYGNGVIQDFRKAFELYLYAALFGDDEACFEISRCYTVGLGVEIDLNIAEIWKERFEKITV